MSRGMQVAGLAGGDGNSAAGKMTCAASRESRPAGAVQLKLLALG